jgi:SRSO17 transposase
MLDRVPFDGTAATGAVDTGKNEAGLDHYQVRLYRAWYRYVTLAMLAPPA